MCTNDSNPEHDVPNKPYNMALIGPEYGPIHFCFETLKKVIASVGGTCFSKSTVCG
jgi:hypothetical protein